MSVVGSGRARRRYELSVPAPCYEFPLGEDAAVFRFCAHEGHAAGPLQLAGCGIAAIASRPTRYMSSNLLSGNTTSRPSLRASVMTEKSATGRQERTR